jgi:hypothetical protein
VLENHGDGEAVPRRVGESVVGEIRRREDELDVGRGPVLEPDEGPCLGDVGRERPAPAEEVVGHSVDPFGPGHGDRTPRRVHRADCEMVLEVGADPGQVDRRADARRREPFGRPDTGKEQQVG